ncbi:MAG TPA: hypothetical protein VF062_25465 [Candidatus Limnocylindrales bacterium]
MAEGDILWRRPDPSADRNGPPGISYPGPPVGEPAPAGWHPDHELSAPPPRSLPAIDDDAVNAAEREAARFTAAIGLIAAMALIFLACWRAL